MKCFTLTAMEQAHLISVCVFCLLCATHIHCSEYSLRTPRSKVKSKANNVYLNGFDRGPGSANSLRGPSSDAISPLEMNVNHGEFLKPIQRSPDPFVYITPVGSDGGTSSAKESSGKRAAAAKGEGVVQSVLHESNGGDAPQENDARGISKYTNKARSEGPESFDVNRPRNGDWRTFENGLTKGRTRKRRRRSVVNYTPVLDEQLYIESLFKKYRNSENKIDLNGFKKMLSHLGLNRFMMPELDGAHIYEHINSMELRDDSRVADNRSTHPECISPNSLLKAVVRESLALELANASSGNSPGEESPDDDYAERPGENEEKSISLATGDLYLSKAGLLKLCPFLIYQLVEPRICHQAHQHEEEIEEKENLLVWLYATASVVIVSLCGLLGVFVIPIMGHAFYQQLLQFLVALAVGTLCGDALLHLLPHAMIPHTDHTDEPHEHKEPHDDHTSTMWKGLAVLLGIVFFFFTEKCLTLASEWRKKHQRNKQVQGHSHVQILNGNNESESVGEKLCKHKYSSYPYCYPDIKSNKDGHEHSRKSTSESSKFKNFEERALVSKWNNDAMAAGENQRLTHVPDRELREDNRQGEIEEENIKDEKVHEEEDVPCGRKDGEYTVIIREHESSHHGHSHAHGHVHSPPESLSSVAWMVILGDGLHNFTDGMAIGAAFANNIAGGCSTAVAVFCHELPHELGDFAVLIKAGMSAKQAVFYNLISSILCFFGMCLGIFVGDNPQSTSWVFAVSAGMFLYIGLVDMFPELTSSHSAVESSFCQCSLQGLGLIAGVSIMLLIAFYEDQLLTLFN